MNSNALTQEYDRRSWWSRFKDGLLGVDDTLYEDEEIDIQSGTEAATSVSALRIVGVPGSRVAVRLNAQVFEDARHAADGLKSGQHQIVNLERAAPQMRERIIDFLNGVIYALDGSVERIGEKVYLFVPANVAVEVDEGHAAADGPRRPSYGDYSAG